MVDQARLNRKVEEVVNQLSEAIRVLRTGHPTVSGMDNVLDILEDVVDDVMAIELDLED